MATEYSSDIVPIKTADECARSEKFLELHKATWNALIAYGVSLRLSKQSGELLADAEKQDDDAASADDGEAIAARDLMRDAQMRMDLAFRGEARALGELQDNVSAYIDFVRGAR